jgi:hypothetical protein
VRLVAVLRNPIERAYSDYLMYVRDGREQQHFATALAEQRERADRGDSTGHYVDTGFYGAQLRRYFDRFDPARIRVHLFDDFAADLPSILRDLFGFLGVDDSFVPEDTGEHNVSGVPRTTLQRVALRARAQLGPSLKRVVPAAVKVRIDRRIQSGLDRPTMPEDCRRRLVETYRADVELLATLLDRDLAHWLEAP